MKIRLIRAEQRCIVARVASSCSLYDELEAGLLQSKTDNKRLIRAVMGRILAE